MIYIKKQRLNLHKKYYVRGVVVCARLRLCLSALTDMPATRQCARCLFGHRCPDAKPSYACVLVCGYDLVDSWKSHSDWARNNPVLGATAYCQTCAHVTWIADDTEHNTALVHSVINSRRTAAAITGMQALCASRQPSRFAPSL